MQPARRAVQRTPAAARHAFARSLPTDSILRMLGTTGGLPRQLTPQMPAWMARLRAQHAGWRAGGASGLAPPLPLRPLRAAPRAIAAGLRAPLQPDAVRDARQLPWLPLPAPKQRSLPERLLSAGTVRSSRKFLGVLPNWKRIDGPSVFRWRLGMATGTVSANLHRSSDEQKFAELRRARLPEPPPDRSADDRPGADKRAETERKPALRKLQDKVARELAQLNGQQARAALPPNPVPLRQREYASQHPQAWRSQAARELDADLLQLQQARALSRQAGHLQRQAGDEREPKPVADLVARVDAKTAHLAADFKQKVDKAATEAIDRLEGLGQANSAGLKRELRGLFDQAVAREDGHLAELQNQQLPLHELEAVLHALRTVSRGDARRAETILQDLRRQSVSELMREAPDAGPVSGRPAARSDVKQALAALADLPRGADIVQAIARPEAGAFDGPKQAYRLEALQMYLRAEKIRASLPPAERGADRMDGRLAGIQASARQRYQAPPPASAQPLSPKQLAEFNLLRNGLIGPGGRLDQLDAAAGALAAYHRRVAAEESFGKTCPPAPAALPQVAPPPASTAALAPAPLPVPPAPAPAPPPRPAAEQAAGARRVPALALVGRKWASFRQRIARRRSAATPVKAYVPAPVPISVMNPQSLAAFNLTSTAYSPDPTLKSAIRYDAHLTALGRALERPAVAHAATGAGRQLTDDERDAYVGVLAGTALAGVAIDGIEQAVAKRQPRIRPEHAQVAAIGEQTTMAEFRASPLHAKLDALCREAGLAGAAGPLPPSLEEAMLAQSKRACRDTQGFPLRHEPLRARLAQLEPQPAAGPALDEARVLGRQLAAFAPAPVATEVSYDNLRNMLHQFVRQAEVRNKFRLTSVAAREVNLAPVSATLPSLLAEAVEASAVAGIGFRVRAEAGAGTGEYFEVSYSSAGLEVAMGEDTRRNGAGGAGFSVSGGYSDGLFSAKGVVGGELARLSEKTRHSGVRFTIPRSSSKAYSDEEARDGEYGALIDSLFPEGGAARIAELNRNDPRGHLLHVLASCPHVSVNQIDSSHDHGSKIELGLNVGVQGKAAVAGAVGTVGWQSSTGKRETGIAEASGSLNIDRVSRGQGRNHSSTAGAGVGLAIGLKTDPSANFGITPLASVAQSKQFRARYTDNKFRFTIENGKTQAANTRNEMEFTRAKDAIRHIELHREEILQLSLERKFTKGYENKSEAERRALAVADLEELKNIITGFETDGKNLSLQNVISIGSCMTDEAAMQNDVLRGERAMLEERAQQAAPDEQAGLEQQLTQNWKAQDALLNAPSSWRIWKIEGSERTSFQKEQALNFMYKESIRNGADGQRALFSFPD